jgi:hypothetical protein
LKMTEIGKSLMKRAPTVLIGAIAGQEKRQRSFFCSGPRP